MVCYNCAFFCFLMSFNLFSIFNNTEQCRKRHLYVCPQFDKTGKCPKSKYCPYPHKLRENLTINLDHMHRCIGDIPEVNSNGDEPKPEEFRYFHLKTAAKNNDLDVNNHMGFEELDTGGLLLKGTGKEVEEIDIDLNMAEVVVNRRRLFDDFFNLVHSDLTEIGGIQSNNAVSMTGVKSVAQELQLDEETLIQIQTDKETEFQMTFVDRLLRQTRSHFMPVDDDEWKKIEESKEITRKHREKIERLLLERAKDRHLKSKVSKGENTEGFNEFQVVTANWIKYILRQCEVVRVQLEALALGKIVAEEVGDYQEMYTPTVLSTLSLISKVKQVLGKLVNSSTSPNIVTKTENHQIDEESRTYRLSSCLVKLLQNLLSTVEVKQLLPVNGTDNEHLISHTSHDMSVETRSSCTYELQDCGDANAIQNKVALCSKPEGNFGIFPCSEGAENPNTLTKRPRVGTIPPYIPL